jgi:hypothetical protein
MNLKVRIKHNKDLGWPQRNATNALPVASSRRCEGDFAEIKTDSDKERTTLR